MLDQKTALSFVKKLLIPLIIILPISIFISLLIAEKLIRFSSPQLTYSQAKSLSLKVSHKSDFLPSDLKPNQETVHFGNTYEFSYSIKINSLGYRMEEFPKEKPPDEYRILMIGDSMTFGYGVEEKFAIPNQLKSSLNKYLKENSISDKKIQIINAGFAAGKAPDAYYLYLAKKGLELKPDLVIVNYFLNNDISDLDDSIWEKKDANGLPLKIASKTTEVAEDYTKLKSQYQNWKFNVPILRNSHLWILFATTLESKSPGTVSQVKRLMGTEERLPLVEIQDVENCLFNLICNSKMQELEKSFYNLVEASINLTTQNDIPLIVTLLPANPQVKNVAQNPVQDNIQPQKRITEFFKKNSLEYIDPLNYMTDKNWQSYYFEKDGHPTQEGYTKLSRAFYDYLTKDWKIEEKVKE